MPRPAGSVRKQGQKKGGEPMEMDAVLDMNELDDQGKSRFGFGDAWFPLDTTLSFVGVGISPPTASWGQILFEAMSQLGRAWWLALFPGAALFVLVLGCNELAEGVRTRLDPRRRTA